MGNEKSKGTVILTLDQDHYSPGDKVSGLVYLHLSRRIRTDTIWLKLSCSETVQWWNSLGRMRSPITEFLLRQKYPLFTWSDREAKPGSYAFPFQIQLPVDLPGSFSLSKHDLKGAIMYSIEAEICGKKSKLAHCCNITVRQRMSDAASSAVSEIVSVTGSRWCREKGAVRVRARCEKTEYTLDETAWVEVEVDNREGKVGITGVRGYLFQIVRLRSGKDGDKDSRVAKTLVQNCEVQAIIRPKEVLSGQSALHLTLDLSQAREQLSCSSTTTGSLIECRYAVEVEVVLDPASRCTGPISRTAVPIVIYSGGEAREALPEAPQGWQPQVMPPSLLRVSPEFDYRPSAPPMEEAEITLAVT